MTNFYQASALKLSECPCCAKIGDIQKRRMNTRYEEDERNFLTSCGLCYDKTQEYWDERWEEYYEGVL